MQRDWGRENELNPILGFSGDGHPRTSPRSLHSIGQTRCVTHEWRGLEEIKFMVQEIHELKPYNAMIQIPVLLNSMQTVSVHDSRCGGGALTNILAILPARITH